MIAPLVVCLLAARAGSDEPTLSCQARRVGDRVLASVEMRRLLDKETRHLLQLGMRGRVRVQASVLRRRFGLFEESAGESTSESALVFADGALSLDGHRQSDPGGALTIERVAVPLRRRERADEPLRVRIAIELRVVTTRSLSRVAAWATEASEEEAASSVVTRALLSAVANDLTTSGECTCPASPSP